MRRWIALCAMLLAGAASAQEATLPAPILTLNQERLYISSEFGQRVREDLEANSADLAAENRRIEAALVAEESQLTTDRATMDPTEFRLLAEDFDERVTGIRGAQIEKREALQRIADQERGRFFELAYPVLFQLVEETGALAILNQSAVILSSRQIDVTDLAIERVNAAIGASPLPDEPLSTPLPRPSPQDTVQETPPQGDD
ncbi:OmpH family outer membrane protein [uncultured Litoreibacter sp.]|uniref:OmpH family outer membrane protein n=1 Tax=uncultured Litoreibacter sp. TaxID=1392394 RepID=UPI00261111CF|nr:OmpH family outer membrane protein [uncultured Litoreibacter sp.]